MKERLEQAVYLSDMYREQCITAEEEVARVREEITHNQKLFQNRTSKLIDKLELTTKVRSSGLPFFSLKICLAIWRIGAATKFRN